MRRTVIKQEAYKATGFTDAHVVRLMAGVRLASVEAAHRIEDMVWHRYRITEVRPHEAASFRNVANRGMGNFQESFPSRLVPHPFLFNVEVAKIQTLWHILRRHGRFQLATLLHDILIIRFRDDYAVSHLLNAGFLDDHYPELASNYWDLLEEPDAQPHHRHDLGGDSEGFTEEMPPVYSSHGEHEIPVESEDQFRDTGASQRHVHCNVFTPSGPDVA
jgi:hypothetical protein